MSLCLGHRAWPSPLLRNEGDRIRWFLRSLPAQSLRLHAVHLMPVGEGGQGRHVLRLWPGFLMERVPQRLAPARGTQGSLSPSPQDAHPAAKPLSPGPGEWASSPSQVSVSAAPSERGMRRQEPRRRDPRWVGDERNIRGAQGLQNHAVPLTPQTFSLD